MDWLTVRRMLPIPNSRWVSHSAHVERHAGVPERSAPPPFGLGLGLTVNGAVLLAS